MLMSVRVWRTKDLTSMNNFAINNEVEGRLDFQPPLTSNPNIRGIRITAKPKVSKSNCICQARLKEVLHYNPESGVWTWLVSNTNCIKVGDVAGCIGPGGYRLIRINGKLYQSSRLAWLYVCGYFPEHMIDHKDRIRDNDKWSNLRHATHSCNIRNSGINSNNTSGVTGVFWDKNRNVWCARIGVGGKYIWLGSFINFINAVRVRWNAEKKYGYLTCQSDSPAFNYLKHAKEVQQ